MRAYTTGVFDILHRGHLNILTQAAAVGELTVGIMSDQGVEHTKGARPILDELESAFGTKQFYFEARR